MNNSSYKEKQPAPADSSAPFIAVQNQEQNDVPVQNTPPRVTEANTESKVTGSTESTKEFSDIQMPLNNIKDALQCRKTPENDSLKPDLLARKYPNHDNTEWAKYFKIKTGQEFWTSEIPSVQNVLDHYQYKKSNSDSSKSQMFIYLKYFCEHAHLDQDQLIALGNEKLSKQFEEFAMFLRTKGVAKGNINNECAFINLFFKKNGYGKGNPLELPRFQVDEAERTTPEYIPTTEEAIKMAQAAGWGSRDCVAILLLAFTGLRNNTLLSLTWGRIKQEIEAGYRTVIIKIDPDLKSVNPEADKDNIGHMVCIIPYVLDALLIYVKNRNAKYAQWYQDLPNDAPVLHSYSRRVSIQEENITFLKDYELVRIVKKHAQLAGIERWKDVKAQSLRKTFEEFLLRQPHEIGIRPQHLEYFLGHAFGGSRRRYFPVRREVFRDMWSKFEIEPNPVLQISRVYARRFGLDVLQVHEELKSILQRTPTAREEIEYLDKRIAERQVAMTTTPRTRKRQKAVDPRLAEEMMDKEGWRYVGVTPDGRWVVEQDEPI